VGHVYSYKGVVLTGIAQTLRPSAAVLEGCAEVTAKWAKKADKGYEAINVDAGRYFSLLAVSVCPLCHFQIQVQRVGLMTQKETRSHDAYRTGISKRHTQAGEYRSAILTIREADEQRRHIENRQRQ
jgi:hypothetical protein